MVERSEPGEAPAISRRRCGDVSAIAFQAKHALGLDPGVETGSHNNKFTQIA